MLRGRKQTQSRIGRIAAAKAAAVRPPPSFPFPLLFAGALLSSLPFICIIFFPSPFFRETRRLFLEGEKGAVRRCPAASDGAEGKIKCRGVLEVKRGIHSTHTLFIIASFSRTKYLDHMAQIKSFFRVLPRISSHRQDENV